MRRIILLLVVIATVAGTALAITTRPRLDDARDLARGRWRSVSVDLVPRYAALDTLNSAVAAAGNEDTTVVVDIIRSLQAWNRDRTDPPSGVRAANNLEGQARRLLAMIEASDRLKGNAVVADARGAFAATTIPAGGRRYNAAVAAYEDERDGMLGRLAAGLMGYGTIPSLDLGGSSE